MKLLFFLLAAVLISPEILAQCSDLKPLFGDKCVKSAKMRQADQAFRKAMISKYGSPDSATRVYLRQAWRHFSNRKEANAMQELNKAWLLNVEDPGVYFAFGHLVRFAFKENAQEAEKYYQLGRDRDPKNTAEKVSYARLIAALDNRRDPQAVIDASAQLIQSFPEYKNGLGYQKRAEAYTQMQMPDRAVKDWEQVILISPKSPDAFTGRGYAYYWLGNMEKASSDYNQALVLDSRFAEAYSRRALLYAESGKEALALADIEKALQIAPDSTEFHRSKANVLLKLNRKTEACLSLKNSIAKGHKSLESFYAETCK